MTLTITRNAKPQPAPGYKLFRALNWGEGVLNREASVGTELYGTSTFAYVPVYVIETDSFSSVNNASLYDRSKGDMENIWKLQPQDGRTLNENFNSIVFQGNAASLMWTGDPAMTWQAARVWYAGSQLQAGGIFSATEEIFQVRCALPGDAVKKLRPMRKVQTFRRADFQKSHIDYPWLITKYRVAFMRPKPDTMSDTFNGLIRYVPQQCLDPQDFKFASSQKQPSAFYVPVQWCISV